MLSPPRAAPVRPLTWRDHPILTDKSILLNGRWKTVIVDDAEFGKGRLRKKSACDYWLGTTGHQEETLWGGSGLRSVVGGTV